MRTETDPTRRRESSDERLADTATYCLPDPGPGPELHHLLDNSAGGQSESWPGDWNTYSAWLFSICLRREVREPDAEDAVQEVFAALPGFRRFRAITRRVPLRPWLVRVLTNKLADLHREHVARRPALIPGERWSELPESARLGLDTGCHAEEGQTIYAVLFDRVKRRCAEPKNWSAFQGVVLEGKPVAEVAADSE